MSLLDFEATPPGGAPRCPSPRCTASVIWANIRGVRTLLNADPDPGGTLQLRDVGGALPAAIPLTTSQRFGKQGKLYSRHEPTCDEARRHRHRRHT